MELLIFNVGHGSFAYLLADPHIGTAKNVALFDCGGDEAGFRPSRYLKRRGVTAIEHLIVSHYDQDHLSDLPNLLALGDSMPIRSLYRNKSLTPDQIAQLKRRSGGLEPGVETVVAMARRYNTSVSPQNRAEWALTGIELATFSNPYPRFQDTNNLSLVAFVHHRDVSVVLPGDLETAGWEALLEQPAFRDHLARVKVFVTSHHGRSNGYCARVFEHCEPAIFVTSDTNKQYGTQEQRYDQHARGLRWDDGGTRRSLTTRRDGHIRIATKLEGGYRVTTNATL